MKKDSDITKKQLFWRVMKIPVIVMTCILGSILLIFLFLGVSGRNSIGITAGLAAADAFLYLVIVGTIFYYPYTGIRLLISQEQYLNRSFENEMRGKCLGEDGKYIACDWYVSQDKGYLYIFHRDAVKEMGEIYRKDTTHYGMQIVLKTDEVRRILSPWDDRELKRLRNWYYGEGGQV